MIKMKKEKSNLIIKCKGCGKPISCLRGKEFCVKCLIKAKKDEQTRRII